MGGAWERLIGIARRILNAILLRDRGNLTHEILSTFMAEVTAIMNARPLTSISYDPESTCLLTPSLLLTQKSSPASYPFPAFGQKDLLQKQWKHVQVLAEEFWQKWRSEYLHGLQTRRKWTSVKQDVSVGDVVLMKDNACAPVRVMTGQLDLYSVSSQASTAEKVELRVMCDGKTSTYVRPISELILLLEAD